MNFLQNRLDKPLICDILHSVDNCALKCGSLLPLFCFPRRHFGFAGPKQSKPRPLESINYKLQILQVLSFDIHANWWGVGGAGTEKCKRTERIAAPL
jgi:hypothetical protein